jgi:peptidoglycan/xylan/chitin deacetylase (PgdA/CDA1 family)
MNMGSVQLWLRYLGIWGCSRLYPKKVPTVLLYHSISEDTGQFSTISPDLFRRQLGVLAERGHTFVGFETIRSYFYDGQELPDSIVCLTFDDGYQDNLIHALPVLEEFQCPAVIYMVSDYVKQGRCKKNLPICSKRELQQLAAHPLITIGGHTETHPKLAKLSDDKAREEIIRNKEQLEDWLGETVTHFAYPYGNYSDRTVQLVKEVGYHTAVTTLPERIRARRGAFRIGRVSIGRGWPFKLFHACCTEAATVYETVRRSIRPGVWR